jgi:hypothetical protein
MQNSSERLSFTSIIEVISVLSIIDVCFHGPLAVPRIRKKALRYNSLRFIVATMFLYKVYNATFNHSLVSLNGLDRESWLDTKKTVNGLKKEILQWFWNKSFLITFTVFPARINKAG